MELELKSWFVNRNRLGSVYVDGEIERQTDKAVFFNGIAIVKPSNSCCKCGKLLTDPVSIELGIGPICAGVDQRDLWTQEQKDEYIKKFSQAHPINGWIPKSVIVNKEGLPVVEKEQRKTEPDIQAIVNKDYILVKSKYEYADLCRSIPSGKWHKEKKFWYYPYSKSLCKAIIEAFADVESKDISQEILDAANELETAQEIKSAEDLPPIPKTKMKPWMHQLRTFWFSQNLSGAGLLFDMGAGKTKTAIDLIINSDDKKVLILCPNNVVRVWPKEFDKHADDGFVVVPCEKNSVEKKTALAIEAYEKYDKVAIVVNYESSWRNSMGEFIKSVHWDRIILDESHRAKQYDGKLGKFTGELKAARKNILTGTPMPHALPVDCPVLTPTGWKSMGELSIEDYVMGSNGQPTKIIGVWPQGEKQVFNVEFNDGTSVECTEEHLWKVISRGRLSRGLPYLTLETGKLNKSLSLPNSNNKERQNKKESLFDSCGAPRWSIPTVSPVNFEHKNLPIDPYLLGILLGDGHLGHSIEFCSADNQIILEVEKRLPKECNLVYHKNKNSNTAHHYRISTGRYGKRGNPVSIALDEMGLRYLNSHEKFIPQQYLWNSIQNRLLILKGLCDADGSSYGSTTKYTTTSPFLRDDVAFLVRSLGGIVSVSEEAPKLTTLPQGTTIISKTKYILFFRLPFFNPFLLERKRALYKGLTQRAKKSIIKIEPTRVCNAQCITVEAEDGLFVTKDFIVTHNSPMDIFAQYRFLDPGVFGLNFYKFRNRYAIMGGYMNKQIIGYQNLNELHEKIYSIAFRVTKDVLDLPEENHIIRDFEMNDEAWKYYRQADSELGIMIGEDKVRTDIVVTQLLRMQQITSGYLPIMREYYDDNDKLHRELDRVERIDSGKASLLEEILEDIDEHEPIVVFTRFKHDLDEIKAAAERLGRTYGELSGRNKDALNDKAELADGIQIAGVQIQAGGVGIDLTKARYGIYYSVGHSLGDYEQSLARIHRPGQTKPVIYYHLVAANTYDETIYASLAAKKDVVESILETRRIKNER